MAEERKGVNFTVVPDDDTRCRGSTATSARSRTRPSTSPSRSARCCPSASARSSRPRPPTWWGPGAGPHGRPRADDPRPDRRPAGELPALPGVVRPAQGPAALKPSPDRSARSRPHTEPVGRDVRGVPLEAVKGRARGPAASCTSTSTRSSSPSSAASTRRCADRPVIVGGTADGSGIVAAASAEARAAGVRAGPVASPPPAAPARAASSGPATSTPTRASARTSPRSCSRPAAAWSGPRRTRPTWTSPARTTAPPQPGRRRGGDQGRDPAAARASTPRSASPPRGWPRGWPRPGRGRAACSSCCPATRRSFLARQPLSLPPRPAAAPRDRAREGGLRRRSARSARPTPTRWRRWSATRRRARLQRRGARRGRRADRGDRAPAWIQEDDRSATGAPTARRSRRSWTAWPRAPPAPAALRPRGRPVTVEVARARRRPCAGARASSPGVADEDTAAAVARRSPGRSSSRPAAVRGRAGAA